MKSFIKATIEKRGIAIDDRELEDLTQRWEYFTAMKEKTLQKQPGIENIAIQNIPRGVNIG